MATEIHVLPSARHSADYYSATQLESEFSTLAPLLQEHPSLPIYTRSSQGFLSKLASYNIDDAACPLAIVCARTEAEVASAIKVCVSHGVQVGIRNRGHDFYKRGNAQDGVIVDISAVSDISISNDKTSVTIGGGSSSGELLQALEGEGLVTPIGMCASIGYTGWACGGGYSMLAGVYGAGADQILGARVVLASGEVVEANADQHADLLWALRGAGNGKFGVITQLRVRTYPKPTFLGGIISFRASDAQHVLSGMERLQQEAGLPAEFSGNALFHSIEESPSVLSIVFSWAALDNNLAAGKLFLEKVRSLGDVVYDNVNETTYLALCESLDKLADREQSYYVRSRAISALDGRIGRILQERPLPSSQCAVFFHNMHGQITVPNKDAAFANRDQHVVLEICGSVAANEMWVDDICRAIDEQGLALDMGYAHFTPSKDIDADKFYGAKTMEKLKQVKRQYDSSNVFASGYPSL